MPTTAPGPTPADRGTACRPGGPTRRGVVALLAGAAAGAAQAQPGGVAEDVGRASRVAKLVPAEQMEAAADQQYRQLLREAAAQRALAPADHPQAQRLHFIAQRIIPFARAWNPRASGWRWEVNLIGSPQVNAFCMPGGKIAFFYGILQKLQLSDDEVATVLGHEMAHALREHARERLGKSVVTRGLLEIGSAVFGLGDIGRGLAGAGAQLATLKFGRDDESEADIVGMDLAARAGYDPAAGITLWQKMLRASRAAPPQFMSTHPAGETRIHDIQAKLGKVTPLYRDAPKPARRFGPPPPG